MSRDKSRGSSKGYEDDYRSRKEYNYEDYEYSSRDARKRKDHSDDYDKYEDRRSHRSERHYNRHLEEEERPRGYDDGKKRTDDVVSSSSRYNDDWSYESESGGRHHTGEPSRYESERSSRYDDERRRHRHRDDDEYEYRRHSRRDRDHRSGSRSRRHERSSGRSSSSRKHRRSRSRSKSSRLSYDHKPNEAQSINNSINKCSTLAPSSSSYNEQYYLSHHIFNSSSMYIPSLPDGGNGGDPRHKHVGSSNDSFEEEGPDEIDKEKIHKETQERLRQHLAKEGKVYPPPKPKHEASHPIFANDGSFLETFKKMQEQQQQIQVDSERSETMHQSQPLFGKRRGGKVLKTGIVQKPKLDELNANGELGSKDPWALYLREVQKYKNASGDADAKTRPLVK